MTHTFEIIQTTELNELAKQQVLDLWNIEYPEKLAHKDVTEFENYLDNLSNLKHFLLTKNTDIILGWALTFDRNNEKWFAIILSDNIKGKGFGRKMVEKLQLEEPILNGWVIDHNNDKRKGGLIYNSPLKFYEKCGFEIQTDIRLELVNISAVKIKWTKGKQ